MYTVALVQNQSEMSHYGCADARSLLTDYDYRLFTGDDIAELSPMLVRRQVHAVLLGSNALNDKDILATLCCPEFAETLRGFLAAGGGFLSFQQIGLAMRNGPTMTLLPAPYDRLRPVVPPREDTALWSGSLDIGSASSRHLVLSYPREVDLEGVRKHAADFRAYQGLYRHYWGDVDLADWDQVLVDPSVPTARALVLASKEAAAGRIVVSALPLDWQKQEDLVRNLLAYVVEGRHHLAILTSDGDGSLDYLRESLRTRRIAFGQYRLPGDAAEAGRHVDQGIHSTCLLGHGVSADSVPEPLRTSLERAVRGGRLRLTAVGEGAFGIRGMRVVSHELRPRHLLVAAELQIQTELRHGYIDDSFWSHVETLQTLESMPDRLVDYAPLQRAAFAITANHDRNGSYDELLGPTCALYWLRAKYLGRDSRPTRSTARWLREQIPHQEPADRALAYHALALGGELLEEERNDLDAVVSGLDLGGLSESQLVVQLRAALAAGLAADRLVAVADALLDRQDDGRWLDLTTTATAASALLDVGVRLDDPVHAAVRDRIAEHVRSAVILILRHRGATDGGPVDTPYLWEGKARTTTKCLQAWLQFEASQDLPVHEFIENLERARDDADRVITGRSALAVLQDISEENQRLRDDAEESRLALERGASWRRRTRWAAAGGVLLVYLLVTLGVGLVLAAGDLGGGFKRGFVDSWGFHSAVAGVVLGVIGLLPVIRKWARGHTTGS